MTTFYTEAGDVFAITCFILALAGLFVAYFYVRPRQIEPETADSLFHPNGKPSAQNGKPH
jgi:hypothetical protein